MRRTLLALVALSRSVHLLAQLQPVATMLSFNTDKENVKIANKSLEFVNIIKDTLRRNNDDYDLREKQKPLAYEAKSVMKGKKPRRAPPVPPAPQRPKRNRIMPPKRLPVQQMQTILPHHKHKTTQRVQHAPLAREPPLSIPPLNNPLLNIPSLNIPLLNIPPLSIPPSAQEPPFSDPLPGLSTMFDNIWNELDIIETTTTSKVTVEDSGFTQLRSRSRGSHSKYYNKESLVERERENNPIIEMGRSDTGHSPDDIPDAQPLAKTVATPPHNRPMSFSKPKKSTPSPGTSPPPTMKPNEYEKELRQSMKYKSEQIPSPYQLDLAPARGPQITQYRFKGRLCQRNMMNIEGPAYDKLGKIVVPAHNPRLLRREFTQTRIPAIILPRCCNCCKKSVLGCQ